MARPVLRGALLFLLSVLATGCGTVPTAVTGDNEKLLLYGERLARLSETDSWGLEGKLAVSSGSDGGSGHFRW